MAEKKTAKKSAVAASPSKSAETPDKPAQQVVADPPAGAGDTQQRRLPLFYGDPRPLNNGRHGGKSIRNKPNYSFAATTNSVPITMNECARAMRYYPIVFTRSDPVVPVVILGLRNTQNDFVNEDGSWKPGRYIPAYIRRYPFILMESADKLQYTLCVDEKSDLLVEDGEQPLFDGEKPSEVTNKALRFCSAYQGQHVSTLEFTAALEKYGLLTENRADVALRSGQKLALSGFRMIDEAKFATLPDDVFLDWRQRGWVPLIYCHLLSMGNWQTLVEQMNETE